MDPRDPNGRRLSHYWEYRYGLTQQIGHYIFSDFQEGFQPGLQPAEPRHLHTLKFAKSKRQDHFVRCLHCHWNVRGFTADSGLCTLLCPQGQEGETGLSHPELLQIKVFSHSAQIGQVETHQCKRNEKNTRSNLGLMLIYINNLFLLLFINITDFNYILYIFQ